jgi:tetratricopeptide (TPR) repeat protein
MFIARSNQGKLGIRNLLALLLVALLALPRIGVCDEDDDEDYDQRPQPTAAQVAEAGALYTQGTDNFLAGNYGLAFDKFNEAFELVKNSQKYAPDLIFNLAKCEVKMGRLQDAVRHYRLYVLRTKRKVSKSGGLKPDDLQVLQLEIQEAQSEIGRIEALINGLPEKLPASKPEANMGSTGDSAPPVSSSPAVTPPATPLPPLPSTQRYFPVASVVLAPLTLGFAATAAGTYGGAKSTYDMLSGPGGCIPACSDEQVGTYQRPLYASYAFWGLAGVSLITLAIVLPFELKKAKKSALRVSWLKPWPAG